MAKRVLFVCWGNICRSPLAEGVAKEYINSKGLNILVDSAGTGDYHIGEAPCENSIKVAKNNSIDISDQKARQINISDFEKFDYIIALDDSNIENIKKVKDSNILKLGSYGYESKDVPDPYFFDGFEGFDEVFKMIDICVKNFIDSIEE
jgi:protein-tyrosine phosphatase